MPVPRRGDHPLVHHDGPARLAGLFSFAAHSPHTVVHIPLRHGTPRTFAPGVPVDLVLAHPSLGLRPSAWPALRRRLTRGAPGTVRTDERRTARHAAAWQARWDQRWERLERADRIHPAVHARTLFPFGARDTFVSAAVRLEPAAGFGPLDERAKGRDVPVTSLTTLLPLTRGQGQELGIGFRAYPPHQHFRPPGRPASRRSPRATSP